MIISQSKLAHYQRVHHMRCKDISHPMKKQTTKSIKSQLHQIWVCIHINIIYIYSVYIYIYIYKYIYIYTVYIYISYIQQSTPVILLSATLQSCWPRLGARSRRGQPPAALPRLQPLRSLRVAWSGGQQVWMYIHIHLYSYTAIYISIYLYSYYWLLLATIYIHTYIYIYTCILFI